MPGVDISGKKRGSGKRAIDLSGVTLIEAGGYFIIALSNDSTLSALGHTYYGMLEDGTNINQTIPVPVLFEFQGDKGK